MIDHERLYYEYSAVRRKPCASLNSWRLVMNHNKFWFLLFWVYYVVNAMRKPSNIKVSPHTTRYYDSKTHSVRPLSHGSIQHRLYVWKLILEGRENRPIFTTDFPTGDGPNLIFDLRNRRCQTALRTCYLPETFYLSPLGPSGCDSGLFWQARFLLGSGEAVGSSPHHPWTHIFCGYILYTAICLNFNALNLCKLPI